MIRIFKAIGRFFQKNYITLKKSLKILTYSIVIGCMLGLFIGNLILMETLSDIMLYAEQRMEVFEEYRNKRMNELEEFVIDITQLLIQNDSNQVELIEDIFDNIEHLKEKTVLYMDKLNKTKKSIDLENVEDIIKANLAMYNFTEKYNGSGTHIKINGKSYILTCAHIIKKDDDVMWADMYDTKLVKIDREKDLALYEFDYEPNIPYLEISTEEPKEDSEVFVIGNPATLEDMITNGIVANIENGYYVLTNKVFFGNSGGCVLYKGKLVGVISKMTAYFFDGKIKSYAYACDLKSIQEFLKDVE